jgi:hypothetical protein
MGRMNPGNGGTLVLKQLGIGWSFLKKRQMGIYLKSLRSHVPLFRSITNGGKFGMSIRNVNIIIMRLTGPVPDH